MVSNEFHVKTFKQLNSNEILNDEGEDKDIASIVKYPILNHNEGSELIV